MSMLLRLGFAVLVRAGRLRVYCCVGSGKARFIKITLICLKLNDNYSQLKVKKIKNCLLYTLIFGLGYKTDFAQACLLG